MTLSKAFFVCLSLATLTVACGDTAQPQRLPAPLSLDRLPEPMSAQQIAAMHGLPADLVGVWGGRGHFEEVIDGVRQESYPVVEVCISEEGLPMHLTALGIVNRWHTYATTDGEPLWDGVGATLAEGSERRIYAWCWCERDGPSSDIVLTPRSLEATQDGLLWSYNARFRLVSLVDYTCYDYFDEDVYTSLVALERYRFEEGALSVEGLARTDGAGRSVSLKLTATLQRPADPDGERTCRLGCGLYE